MKSSEEFTRIIKSYLEDRARTDALFTAVYAKKHKNITECTDYILETVHQSGCQVFSDEEIFSMAVHYYDEDSIKVAKVNRNVEIKHTKKESRTIRPVQTANLF